LGEDTDNTLVLLADGVMGFRFEDDNSPTQAGRAGAHRSGGPGRGIVIFGRFGLATRIRVVVHYLFVRIVADRDRVWHPRGPGRPAR
ncbi:MAG: hypothetical protein ACYTFA_12015, partial [Planctomycetota bacterium]